MPKTHHVIGHKLPWTPYPFHPRVYTLGFGHKFVDWTVGRPDHYGTYCIGLGTGGTGQAIWSDHFLELKAKSRVRQIMTWSHPLRSRSLRLEACINCCANGELSDAAVAASARTS